MKAILAYSENYSMEFGETLNGESVVIDGILVDDKHRIQCVGSRLIGAAFESVSILDIAAAFIPDGSVASGISVNRFFMAEFHDMKQSSDKLFKNNDPGYIWLCKPKF